MSFNLNPVSQQSASGSSAMVPIPHKYLCPITKDLMEDPVAAADGFTYERAVIEEWFQRRGARATSPMTGVVMIHRTLNPNTILRNEIREYVAERPQLQRTAQTEEDRCLAIQLFEEEYEAMLQKRPQLPSAPPLAELGSLNIGQVPEEEEQLDRLAARRDEGDTASELSTLSVASTVFSSTDPQEIARKLSSSIQKHHGNRTAIALDKERQELIIIFDRQGNSQGNRALRLTLHALYPDLNCSEENPEIVIPWSSLSAQQVREFKHRYRQQQEAFARGPDPATASSSCASTSSVVRPDPAPASSCVSFEELYTNMMDNPDYWLYCDL